MHTHILIFLCKSLCVICVFAFLFQGLWILIRYVQRIFSGAQLSAWSAFELKFLPPHLPACQPACVCSCVRCVALFSFGFVFICIRLFLYYIITVCCCCYNCSTLCYYTISSLFIIICCCFSNGGSAQCCRPAFQHFVAIKYSFICHFLRCVIILLAFR